MFLFANRMIELQKLKNLRNKQKKVKWFTQSHAIFEVSKYHSWDFCRRIWGYFYYLPLLPSLVPQWFPGVFRRTQLKNTSPFQ